MHKFKIQYNNKPLITHVILSHSRKREGGRERKRERESVCVCKNGDEIYRIKSQFSISREYFELLIYETTLLILHFGVLRHILYAARRV